MKRVPSHLEDQEVGTGIMTPIAKRMKMRISKRTKVRMPLRHHSKMKSQLYLKNRLVIDM